MNAKVKNILINCAKTLGILLLAVALCELLTLTPVEDEILLMIHILSVLIIACVTPTYFYGLAASVVSTLAYDYFITDPRYAFSFSFTIGSPITLFTMFAVTILASTLTAQMHTQTRLAKEHAAYTQLLHEITQKLLVARDVKTITKLACDYLNGHLGRPVVTYTCDPLKNGESGFVAVPDGEGAAVFRTEAEHKRVHRIFKNGASEALRPSGDEVYDICYFPLISNDIVLGVLGVAEKEDNLTAGDRDFIQMLMSQLTIALELRYMTDGQNRILVEAEKEKMRSTLLRAISHDLRTPLTSILGASSTILERGMLAENQTGVKLVKGIRDDTQWLIRMVENLLVITRISGDNMKVIKTVEAVEEVVAGAVNIVRARFPDYYIHVHAPDELIMAPMDATLISQVIINLLENAVKNSPEESLILLDFERSGDFVRFDVNDNGKGIPEHLLENLFEAHSLRTEAAVDCHRGMGLGLSICRTIVQAHGGSIEGCNREKGGANFTFRLPLEETADE